MPVFAPLHPDHAAVDLDVCRAVKHAGQDARRQRRAGARPAGKRDTRAALPHAHPRMTAILYLDELRVDFAREEFVIFKLRAELREGKMLRVVHEDDRVRISH